MTDLLEGTPYRLVASLGKSSRGEVFRGEHAKLRKSVVIKILATTVQQAPELADRMRLEAQALARLSHPNLVQVIDSGISAGRPFFVMEDDGGVPLGDFVGAGGRMAPDQAVAAVCDLLDGLAFIHDSGLVHRDIQPQNLLVCTGAEGALIVRILDFGAVKVLGGQDKHGLAPVAYATTDAAALGTPRYLSPEQARGGPVDARSDLYSAGCVLYRLLAGVDPFAHHESLQQLFAAHLSEAPRPPSQLAPGAGIGPALDLAVLRALAKRPEERFSSAREMQAALRGSLAAVASGIARPSADPAPPAQAPAWPPAPPVQTRRAPGSGGRAAMLIGSSLLFFLATVLALAAVKSCRRLGAARISSHEGQFRFK